MIIWQQWTLFHTICQWYKIGWFRKCFLFKIWLNFDRKKNFLCINKIHFYFINATIWKSFLTHLCFFLFWEILQFTRDLAKNLSSPWISLLGTSQFCFYYAEKKPKALEYTFKINDISGHSHTLKSVHYFSPLFLSIITSLSLLQSLYYSHIPLNMT